MMQDIMDLGMNGEEMSKLEDTDCEINAGDFEDNAYSFLSEFEENEEDIHNSFDDTASDDRHHYQTKFNENLNPKN